MPTKVEMRYPDGDTYHLATIGPDQPLHAYTEARKGIVNESFMIYCSGDGLQADIFKVKDTEAIADPEDPDEVEDLITHEDHLTSLLRNDRREFEMKDYEVGSFVLVVTQLLEDDTRQAA